MARIVKVKDIPKRSNRCDLQALIKEFYESDAKFGQYQYDAKHYVNAHSADNAIRKAVKRSKYPIKVTAVNGVLYLRKIGV